MITPGGPQEPLPTKSVVHVSADREVRKVPRRSTIAKEPKKLDELFHDTLKDIYYAEKKFLTTLPKIGEAAQRENLSAAFEKHEPKPKTRSAARKVFAASKSPQGKTCDAINGIADEARES